MTRNGDWSTARLGRMHDMQAVQVGRGDVPGVVTLVSRQGETHVDAIGMKAVAGSEPMQRDTIFRIASMTKPIAAVATMILVEECTLRLDEPVDRLLPELADRQAPRQRDGPLDDTVPAKRPITVRDLLTLRMGFGFVMAPFETPIPQAASELQIMPAPPHSRTPSPPDEWMRRFGTLPLMHQPGESRMYPTGFFVLGILRARAAGQPLEVCLRERIVDPLGTKDTAFSVASTKLGRLVNAYAVNPSTGALELYADVDDSRWRRPPVFPDAEGGLVSTSDDYLAFGQMMPNKGRPGDERILSRSSLKLMRTGKIAPERRIGSELFLGDNRDWGFGVFIITRRDDVASVPTVRLGWRDWDILVCGLTGGYDQNLDDPGSGFPLTDRSRFLDCSLHRNQRLRS